MATQCSGQPARGSGTTPLSHDHVNVHPRPIAKLPRPQLRQRPPTAFRGEARLPKLRPFLVTLAALPSLTQAASLSDSDFKGNQGSWESIGPAEFVTRLHRHDHSGMAAMMDAEERWEGRVDASSDRKRPDRPLHDSFVQLSMPQVSALQRHHRKTASLAEVSIDALAEISSSISISTSANAADATFESTHTSEDANGNSNAAATDYDSYRSAAAAADLAHARAAAASKKRRLQASTAAAGAARSAQQRQARRMRRLGSVNSLNSLDNLGSSSSSGSGSSAAQTSSVEATDRGGTGLEEDEEDPSESEFVSTPLLRMSSQYVGPVSVGTRLVGENCGGKTMNSSLVYLSRGFDDESGHHNNDASKTCHKEEQTHVRAVFDTGSTNIWIASDLCKSGPCSHPERKRYNHLESSTYKPPSHLSTLHITFGTGEVSGPQGTDDFHIGPLTVQEQTFGLIETEQGEVFEEVPFEGIVGLAFPQMAANNAKPFFDNIINQKTLKKNQFAFYFSPTNPAANALFWGGVDPQFYEGDVTHFRVTDPYYWSVDLDAFKVGEKILFGKAASEEGPQEHGGALAEVGLQSTKRRKTQEKAVSDRVPRAIFDTGTTFFTAETALYHKVMSMLPTVSCSAVTKESHPDITFTLKSTSGDSHDFVFGNRQYMAADGADGQARCSPTFMLINIPKKHGPGMVLGEVFMRKYFALFNRADGDTSTATLGLALAKQGSQVEDRLKAITASQPSFIMK